MLTPGKVIAVTGASGYIGSWLLHRLESLPGRGRLVAFDTAPPPLPLHNIAVYRQDVARDIHALLRRHRVETVVHLAYDARRVRAQSEAIAIRAHNFQSAEKTLESCVNAGVKHLIYLSSNVIYGANPGNPMPLLEEWVDFSNFPAFPYGRDIYQAEQALNTDYPGIKVTILRACPVLGAAPGSELTARLLPRRLWGVGQNPPYQLLHMEDLLRILLEFIYRETPGVFNVAGDGVVFLREIAELTRRKLTNLPPFLAYGAVGLDRKLLLQPGSIRAELDAVRYPVIMSAAKLKQTMGYRFRYTALETLTAFANYTAAG